MENGVDVIRPYLRGQLCPFHLSERCHNFLLRA